MDFDPRRQPNGDVDLHAALHGETGVNCAVFRNEGPVRSSELIMAADAVAWLRWPGERLYTYVDCRRCDASEIRGGASFGQVTVSAGSPRAGNWSSRNYHKQDADHYKRQRGGAKLERFPMSLKQDKVQQTRHVSRCNSDPLTTTILPCKATKK